LFELAEALPGQFICLSGADVVYEFWILAVFRLVFAGCLALFSFTVACQQADSRAVDENALKDLDAQWSKAASAKDVESTLSYYADDAVLMPPNAPVAAGAAIRGYWKSMLASPGFTGGLEGDQGGSGAVGGPGLLGRNL